MAMNLFQMRPEQMRALARALEEEAERKMVDHCIETMPEACAELVQEELVALVRRGIKKAEEMGLETYSDVLTMVELVVEFGADFEESEPWAVPIWETRHTPKRKLGLLSAAASEEKVRLILEGPDA